MNPRAILIVLDSVGVGELPDAYLYKDEGSNTLGHILEKKPALKIPNLISLGILNILDNTNLNSSKTKAKIIGTYGKMAVASPGKDTTTGHWEMAGIILKKPFPTYPNGFPKDLIRKFEQAIGKKSIGNYTASGTQIIQDLGEEHCETGRIIVYTSADSVFQIAAHEDVVPLNDLYYYCQTARDLLTGDHAVGRVIARPFAGASGDYHRTRNRRDYSLLPVEDTILDVFIKSGIDVFGVGKIGDIFAGRGITKSFLTKNNEQGVNKTIELIKSKDSRQFIFTNLIDFDMLYGHRNDLEGYANSLEEFDLHLSKILNILGKDDVLIITADHGCDPVTPSPDHSREYVPCMVYGKRIKQGETFGVRTTLADVAATLADIYKIGEWRNGRSFLEKIVA
ncbi:MAG: phosphopentomutase [bacterium]